MEDDRSQLDSRWYCQVGSLSLLSILCQLNESHSHSKFGGIQRASRWLIGNGPDVLQDFDWQLGSGKELNRFGASNVAISLDIGGSKETSIIGLSIGDTQQKRR
jgi:hypothetical protein